MHVRSIALSIVDAVMKQAAIALEDGVAEVERAIGTLSGIEYESLESAPGLAAGRSLPEQTVARINRVEPVAE
jgi:Zn finger protein HypA/HybF involved in hydrogenase expression